MRIIERVLFKFFANVLASSYFTPPQIRFLLLRTVGLDLQTKSVKAKCYFNTKNVSIGKDTYINYNCSFYSADKQGGLINIGRSCFFAMNVLVITMTHATGTARQRAGEKKYYPVTIEDGCWIGANSTILPGVCIGKGCIIAAGSVVNTDCAPHGLYAGVPARRIKDLVLDQAPN